MTIRKSKQIRQLAPRRGAGQDNEHGGEKFGEAEIIASYRGTSRPRLDRTRTEHKQFASVSGQALFVAVAEMALVTAVAEQALLTAVAEMVAEQALLVAVAGQALLAAVTEQALVAVVAELALLGQAPYQRCNDWCTTGRINVNISLSKPPS